MKTAEEIKQDIMVEIYSKDRRGPLPERILNLLTIWKEDICKKQREECWQVFINWGDADDLHIADKIKNAPEPD